MSKPPQVGDVPAGKYEVERVIGMDGMGESPRDDSVAAATLPNSPQAMSVEAASSPKTLTSDGASSPGAPATVATAAPWSRMSGSGTTRAQLGLRIGALVAVVSALVIYISTGRPTGTEGAPSVDSAAPAPEATPQVVDSSGAATRGEPTPPAPSAAASAPSTEKSVRPSPSARAPLKGPAPSTVPPPAAAKPAASSSRPAGLFDDRR